MLRKPHRRRQQLVRDWRQRRGEDADLGTLPEGWLEAPRPASRPDRLSLTADLLRVATRQAPSRVAAAASTGFLLLLLPYLLLAPRFRILAVQVDGLQGLGRDALVQRSGLVGRSVFLVNPHDSARRVAALPGLAAAALELRLPRLAVLTVLERPPVLLWQDGERRQAVDAGGGLRPPSEQDLSLPVVVDRTGRAAGQIDCLPAPLVAQALAFAQRFGPLELRPDAGFVARAPEGWEVWLGLESNLAEQQALLLEAERAALARSGTAVRLLDLRYPSRPYFR